jgi:hypothetical protein
VTAESIAEYLHRPLYSISVGEVREQQPVLLFRTLLIRLQLGTTPEILEERLRDLLEVAASWHAVTLIDEAVCFQLSCT